MEKERLLAFSDGVIAIIITIMVLELKVPHGDDWAALAKLSPVFLSYLLSFTYVAIYWNNHHHLLCTAEKINGAIMWANMILLFWLSLIPFATGWMGENHFTSLPTAVYGVALLMPALSFLFLQKAIIRLQGHDGKLAGMVGSQRKERLSMAFYIGGIALSFFAPWAACAIYVAVALMWLVPDRRIEKVLSR